MSRVFNGVRVSEEKARLVRRAATELAFTPSRPARALRRRNSEIIALIIPDIENPFFTSLARGVEDVAQAAGYSVVLCNSDEDQAKETRYLEIAESEQMSGVILAAAGDPSTARGLVGRGRQVVAVDRAPGGLDIDAVLIDGRSGARLATQALADKGFHGSPASPGRRTWRAPRVAGRAGPMWSGVSPAPSADHLQHTDYRVEGGRAGDVGAAGPAAATRRRVRRQQPDRVGACRCCSSAASPRRTSGSPSSVTCRSRCRGPVGIVSVRSPSRHLG